MNVVVLNADYTFLNFIDWRKALTLMTKNRVEVVKYSEKIVNTVRDTFKIPAVVKLSYYVEMIYKRKVSFSHTNVFIRDEFTCGYCGKKMSASSKDLTIDHVMPKSRGGKNDFDNCITACRPCNGRKGDKLLEESGMKLRFTPFTPTVSQYIMKKLALSGHGGLIKKINTELFQ